MGQAPPEPMPPPAPQPILTAPAVLAPVQLTPHKAALLSPTVQIRPLSEAPAPQLGQPALAPGNWGGAAESPADTLALERKKTEAALQKGRAERASIIKRQEMTTTAAVPMYTGAP